MKTKPRIIVQLVHIEGPFKGQIQELTDDEIHIGRHPSCQVRFPADHAIISRKHAKIVRDGNRFKFVDQSTNGTYVNGKPVKETLLKDGDVLMFAKGGPKVSFLTQATEQFVETEPTPVFEAVEKAIPRDTTDTSRRRKKPEGVAPKKEPVARTPAEPPPPPPPPPPQTPAEIRPSRVKVPLSIVFGPTLRSFKELPIIIGKSPDCDFAMEHPQIFDHHAQIFFHQDQYWVKDLTGKKLVLVDGKPIELQAPLTADRNVALTPRGPEFKFLGQGRLIETENSPPPPEDNDDEASQTEDEPDKSGDKKSSLIKRLWRR